MLNHGTVFEMLAVIDLRLWFVLSSLERRKAMLQNNSDLAFPLLSPSPVFSSLNLFWCLRQASLQPRTIPTHSLLSVVVCPSRRGSIDASLQSSVCCQQSVCQRSVGLSLDSVSLSVCQFQTAGLTPPSHNLSDYHKKRYAVKHGMNRSLYGLLAELQYDSRCPGQNYLRNRGGGRGFHLPQADNGRRSQEWHCIPT